LVVSIVLRRIFIVDGIVVIFHVQNGLGVEWQILVDVKNVLDDPFAIKN
jgi:hypothetical protein